MDAEHPVGLAKVGAVLKSGLSGTVESSTGESTTPTLEIRSTATLTETVASIREKPGQALPTESLSPTGQAIAKDISSTLKHTESFIEQKNRDDLLQRLAQHATEIARLQTSEPGKSLRQKAIRIKPANITWHIFQDEQLSTKLGRLTREIVLSSDFRQFLFHAIGVGQQAIAEVTRITKEEEEGEEKSFAKVVGQESKPVISDSMNALLDRLLILANKIQTKPEYRDLLTMLGEKKQRIQEEAFPKESAIQETSQTTWEASLEPSEQRILEQMKAEAKAMLTCIKQLFENLVNTSLTEFVDNLQETFQNISNDDEAIESLRSFVDWLNRCTTDAGYTRNLEEVKDDGNRIVYDLKQSLMEKYQPSVENLLSQLRYYLDRMKRDPLTQKLTGDISSLTSHLFYDQRGNPTLKPELLNDLQLVLPAILRNLRYLKVPDIEIHEPGLDFLATNVVINVGELAPHHLKLIVTSDIPEREGEVARNQIDFEMSKIHAEAQNIRFAVDRSGIPPLTDTGMADIRIYEDGMVIKLSMQPILGRETTELKAGLKVMQAECRLEHFDLNVHGSGHDWMYYLLGPYIRGLVREKIEQSVCNFFMTTDLMASVSLPSVVAGSPPESSQTVPEKFPSQVESRGYLASQREAVSVSSSQQYSQSQS